MGSFRTRRALLQAAALIAGLGLNGAVQAFETFKIAETGQPTPDGTSTYASFSPPAFRDAALVFRAVTADGFQGIYGGTSSLITIAAPFSTAPGGGLFTRFGEGPDVSAPTAVFQGGGIRDFFSFESFEGIYVYSGGSVVKVADTSTPVPDGFGTFTSFGEFPRIMPAALMFSASSAAGEGLYGATASSVVRLADTSTPIPGRPSETFAAFHGFDLTGTNYAFIGESGTGFRGVYIHKDGTLNRVVDVTTPRPDGSGPLGTIGTTVSLHNGNVAFTSGGAVYAVYDGYLVKIMDEMMSPPSHTGPFTALNPGLELSGYTTVFAASAGVRTGLYMGNGGSLWTIRDNSALLDGKMISRFAISNQSLYEGVLAYEASFTDGSEALYATRYVRVPVASWFRPIQQQVRAAGSGGFQILHYNFTLGTTTVSPYAEAPGTVEIPLSRNQWIGAYFYDYVTGRFSQGIYRMAQSPL